jgi:hypothetical protein
MKEGVGEISSGELNFGFKEKKNARQMIISLS